MDSMEVVSFFQTRVSIIHQFFIPNLLCKHGLLFVSFEIEAWNFLFCDVYVIFSLHTFVVNLRKIVKQQVTT